MHRSQGIFYLISTVQYLASTKRLGASIVVLGVTILLGQTVLASSTSPALSIRPQIQDATTTAEAIDQNAQLITVMKEVSNLRNYIRITDSADRWRILCLYQYVSERITGASLQLDATVAQIGNEIVRAQEVSSFLSDRRDRTVTRANLYAILIGGGLGAMSSGLRLSSRLENRLRPLASGQVFCRQDLAWQVFTHSETSQQNSILIPTCLLSFLIDPFSLTVIIPELSLLSSMKFLWSHEKTRVDRHWDSGPAYRFTRQ
jgi:hypothetical protein